MKKIVSLLLIFVMLLAFCPQTLAIESLSNPIFFTWAWGASKIEVDNSLTVVSWSGGSNASYRSGFIVYDLPEDFAYESVKTEVIASFAINSATLNNGTAQAPTAAIVLVDGDKVKQAYSLKSGSSATALLTEAKNNGVLLGTYKIGKYPRTSRIRNANINAFFEKHPDVESIGFYVTNLASDGYSGVVNGIASAMTEFEVNFTTYQNYANTTVNMVDDKGNVLDSLSVRNQIGTAISVPETIEKDGIIWVRDTSDSYYLSESVGTIEVTYHLDKGDREKYVPIIEAAVVELLKNPVSESIELPAEYIAEDGFVINIEWVSDDESVVGNDGSVYQGTDTQTAQLYAKVWIGNYTSTNTKTFTVTVAPLNQSETDEALVYADDFGKEAEKRCSFNADVAVVDVNITDEFTISAHVRVDDLSKGGTIFNICGVRLNVADLPAPDEGRWYHAAMTNSALYIDGEKVCNVEKPITGEGSYIGAYTGKMDNFYVYDKAFSQSVIKSLAEKEYDSPEIEIVSTSVIEGLDGVIVKVATNGFSKSATVTAFSDVDNVRYSGYCEKETEDAVTVFTLNVPNMGGKLTKDNTFVMLWDSLDKMQPLSEKYAADRKYDFGFDYAYPDNHMLSNTFTLIDTDTKLYLTSDGLSQRTDNGLWTGCIGNEGYYYLKNEKGNIIDTNLTFEQVEDNVYKIKNAHTGEYIAYGGNDEWALNIVSYNEVSKVFASEGFMLLTPAERKALYAVTGQALNESVARRNKLIGLTGGDYYALDSHAQAEKLREIFAYYPAYQINRPINKSTTGIEAGYTLSSIVWTTYEDMDGNSKSGYTAKATYAYAEGNVEVTIYARSQNVVRNIAKGFCCMPYQFIKPLTKVVDYNASNNQFKAETGVVYIETNYEVSSDNVAVIGAHELGHLIDFAGVRISNGSYKDAYKDTDICTLSGYGETALNEDFAEFCQFIISCSGDVEQLRQLREMYPGRFDAVCEGLCEMYTECYLKLK
ncbi:MAG: hypothetical protein IKU60_01645 [Clostridia bacterium]|nr:hypothetical protein [Clostridia bacterium]